MTRRLLMGLFMMTFAVFVNGAASAAEPSLSQVYQAAEAGRLGEAQTMMQEVLKAHPDSAKAHFVEAEILAKQGQLRQAEGELAKAERLSPGLPFAKPQSVQNLRAILGGTHTARPNVNPTVQALQAPHETSIPWGMLLVGLGLVAFVIWAARFMSRRNAESSPASGGFNASPMNRPSPYDSAMPPYAAGGSGSVGMPGQGLGSRVMSGLATGAAVGAGVVAGEALMHRFMGGNEGNASRVSPPELGPSYEDSYSGDLGGTDFGVTDSSSWDDNSGGGSDWN